MPNAEILKTLMRCGCTANSRSDGRPACAIHAPAREAYEIAEAQPQLAERSAQCSYGFHAIVPSALGLAFFEYRGPGSPYAENLCVCGYHRDAHNGHTGIQCKSFQARGPAPMDQYYCGCHGWD